MSFMCRDLLDEMRDDYSYAVKMSIMDYLIMSPIEKKRLKLEALNPLLAVPSIIEHNRKDVCYRELLHSWPVNVDVAREEIAWTLQTLSANALELSNLWIGCSFSKQLLVSVDDQEFLEELPMDPETFRQVQLQRCDAVKAALWSSWVPKSVRVGINPLVRLRFCAVRSFLQGLNLSH